VTIRPSIGNAPFNPRPHPMIAQWGVAARRLDGSVISHEVIDPGDIEAAGQPVNWMPADDGSGVLWARVRSPWGVSLAILRAVPLS
jgi:hypothetical protein